MTKYLFDKEVMRLTVVDIYMASILLGKAICRHSQFFGVNLGSALVCTYYFTKK